MAIAALGSIPDLVGGSGLAQEQLAEVATAPPTVFIPGGRFAVGAAWVDGRPVLEAEVRPLRFGVTPVSNAGYGTFLATGRAPAPPWWSDPDLLDPEQPVVGVTWFEAVDYCAWLRETVGGRWRLPTEAEWEHAAFLVPGEIHRDARPDGPVPEAPGPLGRGAANHFGLMDVGSVVREWCLDWFAPDPFQAVRRYDPRGPETGRSRVRRGGSWRDRARAGFRRDGFDPSARARDGGFRVVREVP